MTPSAQASATRPAIGFREFVGLMAALMAITAFGVDVMLPALEAMAKSFDIVNENQRQWIISSFVFGFGAAQIVYGPLADRFGRRPIILIGLFLFVVTSVLASLATSFPMMILARTLQGIAAGAARVLAVSIVRDCYSGRQMARVMSLAMIVFLTVPILAPSVGRLIMLIAPWQAIFHVLAAFAAIVAIWFNFRLGETLNPENRRSLNFGKVFEAAKYVITDRCSLGYTLGMTALFGGMMGFINSSQQLFADTFHQPDMLPLVFAVIASSIGLASYLNSRIVVRIGARRVSHFALVGFIGVNGLHILSLVIIGDTIVTFALFQMAAMFFSGLAGPNFGSMAMEPMGAIAGTAASVQGTMSTLGGATIGMIVGQSFDNSALPVVAGFFLCGIFALTMVFYAERGQLFRAKHPAPPVPQ